MVFLVGGANSAADTGYDIENSLRIEKGDSAYLSDALSSPNTDIFTISMWLKIVYNDSNTTFCEIGKTLTGEAGSNTTFNPHIGYGRIAFNAYDGVANAYRIRWGAPGSFRYRDPAAWYHVVMRMDSSQAVAASRARFYINGEDISSKLTHTTDPDQNDDYFNATGSSIYFGGANIGGGGYWDGYMADVAYIDGTSYAPGTFAETDEDSGIWKPKAFKGDVTFGTNGLYLEFKQSGTGTDSSGLGADTSGNDNHMAVTNLVATDQTTDTPTNNFATFNPLYAPTASPAVYSEGNTKSVTAAVSGNTNFGGATTIGMSNGKWYCEFKVTIDDSSYGNGRTTVGITSNPAEDVRNHYQGGNQAHQWSYNSYNGQYRNSGSDTAYGDVYDDNDIISIALDLDNNKLYFAKNGTWQNSGDPTTGATGTGAISITALGSGEAYHFQHSGNTSSATISTAEANFGNPAYANSSDAADANGYGAFESAPPSGYYAICTKNLAEYR